MHFKHWHEKPFMSNKKIQLWIQRVNYKNTDCIADHWAYLRKLRSGAPVVDLHMKIMQLNCKTPFLTSFFWPSPTNSACFLYILLVYFVTKGKFFFLFLNFLAFKVLLTNVWTFDHVINLSARCRNWAAIRPISNMHPFWVCFHTLRSLING